VNHRAEYQIAFEDFREGLDGINANLRKRAEVSAGSLGKGLLGWVLFIALAVMLFLLLNKPKSPAPAAAAPPPPGAGQGTNLWQIVMPLVPWLLIFGFIWFFVFRQLRGRYYGGYQRTWEQTPWVHRPQSVTIDESGLTFTEPTAERRLSWDHFLRFTETKNLFLLFNAEYSADLIPKRIFATAAQTDEFRALLARHVSPPTGAFPVVPLAPASARGDAGAGKTA
jgi:hypothetical protein